MRIAITVGLAVALLAPAGANAQTYPEPKEPGKVEPKPPRPYETHTVCKKKAGATSAPSRPPSTRPTPATRSRCAAACTRRRSGSAAARSAT